MTEEHKEKIRAGVAKAKAARDAKKQLREDVQRDSEIRTSGIPDALDPQPPFVPEGHTWESPKPAIVEKRSFQIQPGPKVLLTKEEAKAAGHYWRE